MTASTATVGTTFPTLVDVTTRLDPNGSVAKIAETMSKLNPILSDMSFVEGNLPTGHRYTSRTALPSLTWRKFNEGVTSTKSATQQLDESCGMLTGFSKVDCALAKLNGNDGAFRASEDLAFLQAFDQEISTGVFYHSTAANPEKFQGLAPRLSSTSSIGTTSGTGPTGTGQLILADSAASGADQTSIWLVGWSPESVFGIFPKGSIGGLQAKDMGEQLALDANSRQFRAYVTEWTWQIGLCVKDYRYVARVANIDTSNWTNDLSSGADIAMRMLDAQTAIFNLDACNPVYYMSRQTYGMLAQQLVARQANWLEFLDRGGKKIPALYGIPIRFCDALTVAESVIS